MRLCGICHQPTQSAVGQVMHPQFDGGILCGYAGKRTFAYEGEPMPDRPSADQRVIEAQRALQTVVNALRYHSEHEGAPVEVRTEDGWEDMLTALGPTIKALGLPE